MDDCEICLAFGNGLHLSIAIEMNVHYWVLLLRLVIHARTYWM